MSRHTELMSPLAAKLASMVTFSRRTVPVPPSADDIQALEQMIKRWARDGRTSGHNIHEIIDIALRRLLRDLDSEGAETVLEDVRCQISWRQWCTRNGL